MYSCVQFIGYAIPSTPLIITDIGDGPSFMEGRYIGIEPASKDISARIALTMNAVQQTMEKGGVDRSPSTLKIFVMPEFTFRGARGAYDAEVYFTEFRTQFAECVVGNPDYEGWLFVVGTFVNAVGDYVRGTDPKRDLEARVREELAMALAHAWQYCSTHDDPALETIISDTLRRYTKYCHLHPIYEIADRSYVVAGGQPDPDYRDGLSIEKKFISNEDFILNIHSNAYAEEQTAYPDIDEKNGEDKQLPFDDLSIFTIRGIKFGLEVCLDHYKSRIRRNRYPDTNLVQIQLIPSCGMQIVEPSIVAGPGGYVFNCDGQYDELDAASIPGADKSIWTGTDSHRAHTHLTEVGTPCSGNDPTCNQPHLMKPDATVTKVLIEDSSASKLFAYGAGEVHIYSPLKVPPPIAAS